MYALLATVTRAAAFNASPAAPTASPVTCARIVRPLVLQRLQQAALATAAAAVVLSGGAPAALARSTGLDLASCSKFQPAAGLEYCDVRQGSGDSPGLGDQVVVDYTARVEESGKVYDGSRGFQFTLGQDEVIPGWELAILGGEGLPAIREGGARTVRIPPKLAYGDEGYGCRFGIESTCRIPANSNVIITFQYQGLGY